MSVIWPQVRSIKPQKIEPCCVIKRAEKVSPRTIPRNFVLIAHQHLDRDPAQSTTSASAFGERPIRDGLAGLGSERGAGPGPPSRTT